MLRYESKVFSKTLHWERGWEEPLVKIAKTITMGLLLCIQYFDEKFDNDNNLFERNTGNYSFFKKSTKAGDILAKQESGG